MAIFTLLRQSEDMGRSSLTNGRFSAFHLADGLLLCELGATRCCGLQPTAS